MVKNATVIQANVYDSNCKVKADQTMRVIVQVDKVQLSFLHDKYQMEIFRLESS